MLQPGELNAQNISGVSISDSCVMGCTAIMFWLRNNPSHLPKHCTLQSTSTSHSFHVKSHLVSNVMHLELAPVILCYYVDEEDIRKHPKMLVVETTCTDWGRHPTGPVVSIPHQCGWSGEGLEAGPIVDKDLHHILLLRPTLYRGEVNLFKPSSTGHLAFCKLSKSIKVVKFVFLKYETLEGPHADGSC